MRKIAAIALVLLSVALATSLMAKDKDKSVDAKNMNRIFVGWVGMNPDDYRKQGYGTREEFLGVIRDANLEFQKNLQAALSGKTVTGAKDSSDQNTAGNDLYIKFSDVEFTHGYRLRLAIHFIDLKTNAEVGLVPLKKHTAHFCGLVGCMRKELEEVSSDIQKHLR